MKMLPNIEPDSAGNQFRQKRMKILRNMVDQVVVEKENCRVIDIGGTYNFWSTWKHLFDWHKMSVTCVNLDPSHYRENDNNVRIEMVRGDACNLSNVKDKSFDIAFSNSVIEHVGNWNRMMEMSSEVRRVADGYLVQTPYFWFPIEPHARTPFLHWLPESMAYRIVMYRKCGFWSKQETVNGAVQTVQSAHLLDKRQLEELFPDATIQKETFFFLTKSLIAIKNAKS
jgi:ubiquinone/menaquinone biosynthesis C-methylase UbiE